jgi:hypothetical protein
MRGGALAGRAWPLGWGHEVHVYGRRSWEVQVGGAAVGFEAVASCAVVSFPFPVASPPFLSSLCRFRVSASRANLDFFSLTSNCSREGGPTGAAPAEEALDSEDSDGDKRGDSTGRAAEAALWLWEASKEGLSSGSKLGISSSSTDSG